MYGVKHCVTNYSKCMRSQSVSLITAIVRDWTMCHKLQQTYGIKHYSDWVCTAVMSKWRHERSSRLIRNLSNCEREAWKKFRLQRDSNPWPLRYRCSALPTELWSHNCWEQVNFSGSIMPLRVMQHYSDWVCTAVGSKRDISSNYTDCLQCIKLPCTPISMPIFFLLPSSYQLLGSIEWFICDSTRPVEFIEIIGGTGVLFPLSLLHPIRAPCVWDEISMFWWCSVKILFAFLDTLNTTKSELFKTERSTKIPHLIHCNYPYNQHKQKTIYFYVPYCFSLIKTGVGSKRPNLSLFLPFS